MMRRVPLMMQRESRRKQPRRSTRLRCYGSSPTLGELASLGVWSLGPGGAGLEHRGAAVHPGDRVELLIDLPGEPTRLMIDAEVVWVHRPAADLPQHPAPVRFGVRFDGGPFADLRLLMDFARAAETEPGG